MKKYLLLGLSLVLAINFINAQDRQEFKLNSFEHVDLDGNIRLYVEYGKEQKVVLEAKRDDHLYDYEVEVRNNTLYVKYIEDGWGSTPKIKVYLTHPGVRSLDLDGYIYVYAMDTMRGEELRIKGDGLIRGELDVEVDQLTVGLDGMCKMTIAGIAENSDLRLDGMGNIDARGLRTNRVQKSADGLASIKVNR